MLRSVFFGRLIRAALVIAAGLLLASCEEYSGPGGPKELRPVPPNLVAKMEQLDMAPKAPIYVRGYKESSELEIWKQTRDGSYKLLTTYSICRWSGVLGPKIKEGDRQAPEGFYTITPGQMNPKSNYYLSFNIGFPNAYDRALGRTGTNIMVHGACSSAGCYSMTDQAAGEIYALARDAFRGGQRSFEVHLFPFRMTPENMAKHRNDPNYAFWVMLKEGSDHFALTSKVPTVGVCGKRYVFNARTSGLSASAPCPPLNVQPELLAAVKAKQASDDAEIAVLAPKFEQERQLAAAKAAEQAARVAAVKAANAASLAGNTVPQAPATAPAPEAEGLAVAPETPVAATGAAAAAAAVGTASAVSPEEDAIDPVATAALGGTPAPGMPLPVASPLRPVVTPVAEPEPQPGFWGKIKKKIPIPLPFG